MIKTFNYYGHTLHISLYKDKPILRIHHPKTHKEMLVGVTTQQYHGETPYVITRNIPDIVKGDYIDVNIPRYKSVLDAFTAAKQIIVRPTTPHETIHNFFTDLSSVA